MIIHLSGVFVSRYYILAPAKIWKTFWEFYDSRRSQLDPNKGLFSPFIKALNAERPCRSKRELHVKLMAITSPRSLFPKEVVSSSLGFLKAWKLNLYDKGRRKVSFFYMTYATKIHYVHYLYGLIMAFSPSTTGGSWNDARFRL